MPLLYFWVFWWCIWYIYVSVISKVLKKYEYVRWVNKIFLKLKFLDETIFKFYLIRKITRKNILRVIMCLLLFFLYMPLFIFLYTLYLLNYVFCLRKLKKWAYLKPLVILNYRENYFLGYLLIIPNACAYSTLVNLISNSSGNYSLVRSLGMAVALRLMLGFSPILPLIIELAIENGLWNLNNKAYDLYYAQLLTYHSKVIFRSNEKYECADYINMHYIHKL